MNKRDFIKSMFAGLGAAAVPGAILANDFLPTEGTRLVFGGKPVALVESIRHPSMEDGRVILAGTG